MVSQLWGADSRLRLHVFMLPGEVSRMRTCIRLQQLVLQRDFPDQR
jgi:hypothetical protein